MPKATAPRRRKHAEQIPAAGPHHRDLGRQSMGVDDRRYGVGRVVEAVDEFEAERNQHRDAEQDDTAKLSSVRRRTQRCPS